MKQKDSEVFKESLIAQYREQVRAKRLSEKSGPIPLDEYHKKEQSILKIAAHLDGLTDEEIEDLLEEQHRKVG
jgi:hypothetical protein